MAIIKINGSDIKDPTDYKFSISDYDSDTGTGRNANGEMFRDRIASKRKLSLSWGSLTQAESSTILNLVRNEFFQVTYPDAQLGMVTKTFYVGDREMPMYRYNESENTWKWEGLSMNFIEK